LENLAALGKALKEADAVVIGAGAGLSTSAGFVYSGERFDRYFPDFKEKYGFTDMYAGGFHRFQSQQEFWAYWSRYILVNRYMDPPKPVYEQLFALIREKDYFVLTTNVDHCFQKAGFDKTRLFYTQGDYGLFQCSVPCDIDTYDNEAVIKEMVVRQQDMRIPDELLPRCPKCGAPLTTNLRADNRFVEDVGWLIASDRYEAFIKSHQTGKILYLELGVGYNTPVIIKYPFWKMALENEQSIYAAINFGEAYAPVELEPRSILIDGDIGEVLGAL